MHQSAAGYFGSMWQSYDSLIRRAAPRYDEMIDTLVAYLPATAARILELGCGTGNLTLRLAARFPQAQVTVVDASPEMLDVTRQRLSGRPVTGVACRFEEVSFEPGSFDLVVSSISLHHVAAKADLFARLRPTISRGGALWFADQMAGGSEASHRLNWEAWLAFCRQPGHCTPDEIQSLLDHAEAHDHYDSVLEHARFLQQADFTSIDCVWRHLMWAIMGAEAA